MWFWGLPVMRKSPHCDRGWDQSIDQIDRERLIAVPGRPASATLHQQYFSRT